MKTAEIIGIDAFARRIPEEKHRNSEKLRELMLPEEESMVKSIKTLEKRGN